MKKIDNYIRLGTLERVIDGDTVIVNVDLGFSVWTRQRFRLYGIQAPERNTSEGQESKRILACWLPDNEPVVVEIIRSPGGKFSKTFDRFVCILHKGQTNINNMLVRKGFAKKWLKFKRFKKKSVK